MRRILWLCVCCAIAPAIASAQTQDEKAAQAYVEDFLQRLGDGQYATLDADLTPKALVVVVRERDGQWTTNFQTGEEWLGALKKNPTPTKFREPITNVAVTVDSNRLAYVRGDFQVLRDGRPVSSGVDQFTLVRDGDRWKIAVVAYTSLPVK